MLITTTDLLIRIKNSYMVHNHIVEGKYSRINEDICKLMTKLGYIDSYEIVKDNKNSKSINIILKYNDGQPALKDVKLISKPGRKIYIGYKKMKKVLGGIGHGIVSTPKGIITQEEAKKLKVGGELICYLW